MPQNIIIIIMPQISGSVGSALDFNPREQQTETTTVPTVQVREIKQNLDQ